MTNDLFALGWFRLIRWLVLRVIRFDGIVMHCVLLCINCLFVYELRVLLLILGFIKVCGDLTIVCYFDYWWLRVGDVDC